MRLTKINQGTHLALATPHLIDSDLDECHTSKAERHNNLILSLRKFLFKWYHLFCISYKRLSAYMLALIYSNNTYSIHNIDAIIYSNNIYSIQYTYSYINHVNEYLIHIMHHIQIQISYKEQWSGYGPLKNKINQDTQTVFKFKTQLWLAGRKKQNN